MKVSGTPMTTLRISITVAALALLATNSYAQTAAPVPATPTDSPSSAPALQQAPKQTSTPSPNATQTPQDENRAADAYYNFAMGHAAEDEYEITGRNDAANQAVEYYKKALALDPGSSVIIERLAETYAKSQRTPEAIAEAEQAIKADPDNPGPHRLLARIYVRNLSEVNAGSAQRDTIDKAIEQFREILRLDPKDGQSALWLARLYRFENEHDKAEETLRTILTRDPQNEGALEQMSQLLMDEGRTPEAIELLTKAAALTTSPTLFDLLGDAYSQSHEYAKAEDAYRKAVDGDPDEVSHRKELAQTLLTQEKFPEALEEFKKLAIAEPEAAENYLRLSQIYRHMNRFDEAEESIVKAKQLGPGNLEIVYNEALVYDAQGHYDDAAHVLADAIAGVRAANDSNGNPSALAILYEEMGRIYREKKDYSSAEKSYEELAKLGPESAKRAQMLLIDTYRESHEIDRALTETQKAIKDSPKDRGLVVTYAILLGEKGQLDEADKVLRGLLKGGDDDEDVYLDLAQVQERGRPVTAEEPHHERSQREIADARPRICQIRRQRRDGHKCQCNRSANPRSIMSAPGHPDDRRHGSPGADRIPVAEGIAEPIGLEHHADRVGRKVRREQPAGR